MDVFLYGSLILDGTLWLGGVQKRGTPFCFRVVVGPLDGHKQDTPCHWEVYFKYYFYYINFKNITLKYNIAPVVLRHVGANNDRYRWHYQ